MALRSLIVIGTLVVTGCGKDTSTTKADHAPAMAAAAGTGKKPCEYMVRADAEAALGIPLPKTMEQPVTGECDYTSAEYYGAALTVGEWDGVKLAATTGGHKPEAVSGVGDEALNLGGHLYVRKGTRGFMLALNGPAVDGLADRGLAITKVLAQKILASF